MPLSQTPEQLHMRSVIQRIATGPELSKDIAEQEAIDAAQAIFEGKIDPVQAAIFFIALRMKRESPEENTGVLQAILNVADSVTADVDEVVDIADPYDGYNRTLPASPFLAPLLAECGIAAISHGLDACGPKYGITHRHVLEAAGINVDLSTTEAAARLSNKELGWGYVDQANFCKPLHDLIPLRTQMIKRNILTTVEVLAKPISGKLKTHFVTGYVHKPYPPVYAMLARHAGFDSALLIRGVEGGVIPSLRQEGKYFHYHDKGEEVGVEMHPNEMGIEQTVRSVAFPDDLPKVTALDEITVAVDLKAAARVAADAGIAALGGEKGATYDSLVCTASLILQHTGQSKNLAEAGEQVRAALDSGNTVNRLK